MTIPDGWHSTVRRLKRDLPPPHPVSVRTVKSIKTGEHGYTEFDGKRFTIYIERGCHGCMWWTLAHEWGHLSEQGWTRGRQPHPDSMGPYYMQAYRIVFDAD